MLDGYDLVVVFRIVTVFIDSFIACFWSAQGPKVAVQGLSFSVARGDCFGFLGINGAGMGRSARLVFP